jgi:energy-coupling factor transport system permease protein
MPKSNVTNFMSNIARQSWVHRLDPRTKVALLLVFSTLPIFFTDPRFIFAFVLLILPIWLTANVDFRPLGGPLFGVGIFLTMLFLLTAVVGSSELTNPDPYSAYTWYYQLGPLVVTSRTVTRGLWLAMRLAVPLTTGLLIITTTDPTYLAKGLRKLKMPTEIVFMILAGLRFIPIVTEQLFNILDAQTVRGVENSRIKRIRLLMLPLFITSLRRTRTMGLACEAKGFGARRWNNFYETFSLKIADKLMLAGLALVAVTALVVRFGFGYGMVLVGLTK